MQKIAEIIELAKKIFPGALNQLFFTAIARELLSENSSKGKKSHKPPFLVFETARLLPHQKIKKGFIFMAPLLIISPFIF